MDWPSDQMSAKELLRDHQSLMQQNHMTHLPHNAASQATPDSLAGSIDLMFMFQTSASPQIKAGKPRAHAVSTATRTPAAPDTPVQFAALFHRQMPTRARVVRDAKLRATN